MKNCHEVAENVLRRRDEYRAKQARRHRILQRAGTAISVVVLIICFLGTAGTWYVLAAHLNFGDWYKNYFHNDTDPTLTTLQKEYIDKNAVGIGQSVTCNGISVTVQSAITDGHAAYILMDIAGPAEMDLDALNGHGLGFQHTLKGLNPGRHSVGTLSAGFLSIDDGDGQYNTISMLLRIDVSPPPNSAFTFADGMTRVLRLENFGAYLDEYPYSRYTLAEGEWVFSFVCSETAGNDVAAIQVLDHPITVTGTRLMGDEFEMILTSMHLRALSASCFYTFAEGVRAEASDFGPFKIVMKDGSVVMANPRGAGIWGGWGTGVYTDGHCNYLFDAPVVFDQIDHLLLSNGTKILVNP